MADSQKFCLRWNNFQRSVTSVFDNLRQDEELVDITLCCEGKKIKAHRMMLSACSPYFRELFKDNPCQHPLFFLKDTSYADLAAVVEFVYKGEVNVLQNQLPSFLKTAEMLQVKGLSGNDDESDNSSGAPQPAPASIARDRISESAVLSASSPLGSSIPPPPLSVMPRSRVRDLADRPTSPRQKRRRLSGGGGGDSPVSAAAAPPLTPAPPSLQMAASEPPTDSQLALGTAVRGVASEPLDFVSVKMEKSELELTDEEASLEATLGQVSKLEAGYDGSDHSANSNDMTSLLSRVGEQGGVELLGTAAGISEDGTTPGGGASGDNRRGTFRCRFCGRIYNHLVSLGQHMKLHTGDTTCHVCGKILSRTTQLRIHMRQIHGLDTDIPAAHAIQ